MSAWAIEEAKQRLAQVSVSRAGATIAVSKVVEVSGDASLNYVRGKKRSGFDLNAKLEVSVSGTQTGTATVVVEGATPAREDMEMEVQGGASRELKQTVRAVEEALRDVFDALAKALADK